MVRPDRAVILAAGLGTRLRWLTANRPKALMPVAGEAVVIHCLRHLITFGVKHVVINLHHHGEQIATLLGDGRQFGISIRYSRETTLLDSGGGVRRACTLLPEGNHLIVHNADIITDIALQQLWQQTCVHDAGAVLALVPNPTHNPKGDFCLQQHGLITSRCEGLPTWTYAGVSLWSQQELESSYWGERFSLLQPIRALISSQRLYGTLHHGSWLDIGRPRALLSAISGAI